MIQYFVFSKGRLISQDSDIGFLKVALYEDDVHIWVDVERATPAEASSLLEGVFGFHPLAIEDCVAVSERPKIDQYDNYLFMVFHAIAFSPSEHAFSSTELNLFVGKNYIVTYHQDPIRSIAQAMDLVRRNTAAVARAPDRLTYTILDLMLDNYDPALVELAEDMTELEKNILVSPSLHTLNDILHLKTQIQKLRQIMLPQREVIARLAHGEFKLVRAHLLPYYRDLLDRMARYADTADGYRDSLTNTIHILLNLQQSQTNQVVKILTVMATLALPLLAVTSFYGMNFRHMPELDLPYGYLWWTFGITAVLTGLIYLVLKRRNWM